MLEDLTNLNHWVHSAAGTMHLVAALIALIIGPVLFMRPKGRTLHRWLGSIYVIVMLALNISALTMFNLSGVNLFHFFAVVSLSSIIPGMFAISKAIRSRQSGWIHAHGHFMAWSYYGLFMAGTAQILYRTVPHITGSYSGLIWFWAIGMPVTAGFTSVMTRRTVPKIAERYAPSRRRNTARLEITSAE